jgi:hypothetical protein
MELHMKKNFRILDIDFKVVDKNRVEVINPDSYVEYLIKASDGIRANIYSMMEEIVGEENMPDFIDVKVGKSLFRIGYGGELWEKKKAGINEVIKKIAEELKGEPIDDKKEYSSKQQQKDNIEQKETIQRLENKEIKEIEEKFLNELSSIEQNFLNEFDKLINESISKNAEIKHTINSSIIDTATPKYSDVEKSLRVIEEYLADINDPILNIAYDRVKRFLMSGFQKETNTQENNQESISSEPVESLSMPKSSDEMIMSCANEYINKIIKIAKQLAYEEVELDSKKVDDLISTINDASKLNLDYEIKEMMNELKKKLEEFKKKNVEQEKIESNKKEVKELQNIEKTKEMKEPKEEGVIKEKASIKKKSADVKEEFKKVFEEESNKTNDINQAVKNTVERLKGMGYNIKTAKDAREKRISTFKVGDKVWLKEAFIKDDTNFGVIKAISNNKAIVDWGNEIPTEELLEDLVREDDYKIDFNINLFTNSSNSNGKIIRKDSRFDAELARMSFKDKFNDIQRENDGNRIKIGKFEGNIIKDNDGKLKIQIGDKVLTFFKYHVL